jgi:hypothetical protein
MLSMFFAAARRRTDMLSALGTYFLGAFEKLRKATICFEVFVRPHGTALSLDWFLLNLIFERFLKNQSRKFKFNKNLTRIMGSLLEDQCIFFIISRLVLLRMRNVSDKVTKKIKTHILCSVTFFFNRPVYEIMWKNIVELGRPQRTTWRMRFECWIPKVTITHSQYLMLNAFLQQQ